MTGSKVERLEPGDRIVGRQTMRIDMPRVGLSHVVIGYQRVTADSILAWVEVSGAKGAAVRRIESPYHRVRCEQSTRPQ